MELEEAFEKNRALAVETLREMISIESVQEDPVTNAEGERYPFGRGVQDAFAYMLAKGEEFGFRTVDFDHFGGHIEFGDGPETVGILGHLDVVPPGDGWDFAPFSGDLVDGYVLGRGTTDDKGPLLAAFFAMKILRDAGFAPARKIRLILGLDEETNWNGMTYYLEHAGNPTFGFTPDAEFPAVQAEKGILHFDIAKKLAGRRAGDQGFRVRRLDGGTARNAVPGSCEVVLNHKNPEKYETVRAAAEETAAAHEGAKIRVRRTGASLKVTAEGRTAHAAQPEKGLNAVSLIFELLGKIELADDGMVDFVRFYNTCIGFAADGKSVGCALSDEVSGDLTFCVGMAHGSPEAGSISVDVRYPVTKTADDVFDGLRPFLDRYGLGAALVSHQAPIYQPEDSILLKTLVGIYQEETGDRETKPVIMGGGTFARACPNIVAFGGLFPGDPDLMHQKNEKIAVSRYEQMIRIYMRAIGKIAAADFVWEER